jgi:hypothetical protein
VSESTMKEPRVEKIVSELKNTVDRLNRIQSILNKTGTTFTIRQTSRDTDFIIEDITQRINYE